MKKYSMLTDSPGKSLFFFALPMIIGNLFQQFYNLADTVIVGRFLGEDALAAVGASYSLTNVFIMIAIGGGIGASVLTSQYLGAENYKKMRTSSFTSLLSYCTLAFLLAIFGYIFHPQILLWLKTPANIYADACTYLRIYFTGLPFLFMYNILSASFNALGKSKIPLFLLIFSSLLNIGLDLLAVSVLHMGVGGAAIATVFSQGVSAVISFFIFIKLIKKYPYGQGEKDEVFSGKILLRMIKLSIPSIIQQSIVSIGILLCQSAVNSFGSSVLAGYTAGSRIESICIVPMIATGNAVSTFAAQNLGAANTERVKKGYKTGVIMVFGFAVVLFAVVKLFGDFAVRAFLEEGSGQTAFHIGSAYVNFLAFFYVFIGLKSITDGVLRGAGDMTMYMVANLVNLAARVLIANYLSPLYGVEMIWYAIPLGWALNFTISFIWFCTGRWKKKRII